LFCGNDQPASGKPHISYPQARYRSLPFTDTDAYRNVKAATEAFVMANCGVQRGMTSKDEEYVLAQLSLDPGPHRLAEIFASYQVHSDGLNTLPYLALIRRKLKDQGIKTSDIGDKRYDGDRNWRSDANSCYGVLKQRLTNPCLLELIWSYWQEE